MTKKSQKTTNNDEDKRQSRKDILVARKQERDLRNLRIAIGIILGMVGIVIVVALVNELIVTPNRPVITLGDATVSMKDWQDRVQYERAQRVIYLENQYDAFGGDVGLVQQFGSQAITDLLDPEGLGQTTIDTMADELAICGALEDRGITITDADIDAEIGAAFNYFDGQSPTETPDPTATIMPTPSLTPIPVEGAEATPTVEPSPTPTAGPTATALPTPTPVSEASFQEQFGKILTSLQEQGVDEATYRQVVRAQLCRDRFADVLAEEQGMPTIAPHASIFLIAFDNEDEATAAAAGITDSQSYLTEWNTVRSQPAPTTEDDPVPTSASYELLWRTQDSLANSIGSEIAAAAFELGIDEPSGVFTVPNGDGTSSYYVIMVSGREDRELSDTELESQQQELVQSFLDDAIVGNLVIDESWRNRVPNTPLLDPKFLVSPTAVPTPTFEVGVTDVPSTPDSGE